MTGPPIVELGFSVELEEELSGDREPRGYELTVEGITEWGKELAELGLDELDEAHTTLLESLFDSSEKIWEEFIGSSASDFVEAFGDFLRDNEVAQELLGDAGTLKDFIDNLAEGKGFAAAMWAFEVNAKMIQMFFDEVLPFLEDWVDQKDLELDRKIEKNLEREKEGGGSASDDDIDKDIDDAIDDFFNDMDQDDFQPEDVEEFDTELDDMSEELDDTQAELGEIESESSGESASEIVALVRELRQKVDAVRVGLASPIKRMGEWSRR